MTMQLSLVNNDPTSTLLVNPDGEAMFSAETPSELDIDSKPQSVSRPHRRSHITTVKRLNRYHQSTGHVETSIGVVEYKGSSSGTDVQLCTDDLQLNVAPWQTNPMITNGSENKEEEAIGENSWEFMGPNSTQYKWQMFCQSPVLILNDNSFTPLARYRRAKLGIVSRSRRAFLEIMPAGLGIIDLIVVTFVGFMKQRVLVERAPTISTTSAIRDNFVHATSSATLPPHSTPAISLPGKGGAPSRPFPNSAGLGAEK